MRDRPENELNEFLRNYSEQPREELWGRIKESLTKTIDTKSKSKNGRTSDAATGFSLLLFFLSFIPFEKTPFAEFVGVNRSFLANATSSAVGNLGDTKNEKSTIPAPSSQKLSTTLQNSSHKSSAVNETLGSLQPLSTEAFEYDPNVSTTAPQATGILTNGTELKTKTGLDSDGLEFTTIAPAEKAIEFQNTLLNPERGKSVNTDSLGVEKKDEVVQEQSPDLVPSKPRKNRKNTSLYFIAMPTFGYQRIDSKTNDMIVVESINKIPMFSFDRLGMRLELGMEHAVLPKLSAFAGIIYYQRKQTIGYIESVEDTTRVDVGPNGELTYKTERKPENRSFEYELKNIGIQIGANYQLSKKKFLQTVGTGIEFHLALNKLSEKLEMSKTNNPSAYVFYNFYYRLQYPAEGRLKAVFQPTLNYSVYINQNFNAPFYVKPYGLGLNLGFTYNF